MLKVFSFIEVVESFHYYVMNERTGDAYTFARRLGIARSSLYNLIDELKSYGIEIEYNRHRKTYLYSHPELVTIIVKICQRTNNE